MRPRAVRASAENSYEELRGRRSRDIVGLRSIGATYAQIARLKQQRVEYVYQAVMERDREHFRSLLWGERIASSKDTPRNFYYQERFG